jgi:hypothetical protein
MPWDGSVCWSCRASETVAALGRAVVGSTRIHRDYHPGNVLPDGVLVTGVVGLQGLRRADAGCLREAWHDGLGIPPRYYCPVGANQVLSAWRFTATRLGLLGTWTDVEVLPAGQLRLTAAAEDSDSGVMGAMRLLLRPDGTAEFMSAGVFATDLHIGGWPTAARTCLACSSWHGRDGSDRSSSRPKCSPGTSHPPRWPSHR